MSKHAVRGPAAAFAGLWLAGVAAHHSDSAYFIEDRRAEGGQVRIEGTVTRARLINPHAELWVEVPNDAGGADRWIVEMDSWNELRRYGWTQDTVAEGDHVAVVVAHSKFHPTAGRLRDFLIFDPQPGLYARLFLEYIPDSENAAIGRGSAPERLLARGPQCPNYRQVDIEERSRGEDSILCFALDEAAYEAVLGEFGAELVILEP